MVNIGTCTKTYIYIYIYVQPGNERVPLAARKLWKCRCWNKSKFHEVIACPVNISLVNLHATANIITRSYRYMWKVSHANIYITQYRVLFETSHALWYRLQSHKKKLLKNCFDAIWFFSDILWAYTENKIWYSLFIP